MSKGRNTLFEIKVERQKKQVDEQRQKQVEHKKGAKMERAEEIERLAHEHTKKFLELKKRWKTERKSEGVSDDEFGHKVSSWNPEFHKAFMELEHEYEAKVQAIVGEN